MMAVKERRRSHRAAVNQQPITLLEVAALEDVVPNREDRFGERSSLHGAQALRGKKRRGFRRHRIFRVATTVHEGADEVAQFESCDLLAHGNDRTRDFEPQEFGCAFGWRVEPLALQHVRPVDPGGCDRDEDFALFRLRQGSGRRGQHLRSARLADIDHGHCLW